jgi:very-short-patch-repair endonuclease
MGGIVTGQRVNRDKLNRARGLRREQTAAEARLWEQLRANRLNGLRFRRQQVIDGFIVDFYCNALRLVIEIDGPIHDGQVDDDQEREYVLTGRGLTFLRFTNDQVLHDLPSVLARITALSHERVTPPL